MESPKWAHVESDKADGWWLFIKEDPKIRVQSKKCGEKLCEILNEEYELLMIQKWWT